MPCEQSLSLSSESQWIESTREASGEAARNEEAEPRAKKIRIKKIYKRSPSSSFRPYLSFFLPRRVAYMQTDTETCPRRPYAPLRDSGRCKEAVKCSTLGIVSVVKCLFVSLYLW